ncbi:MAG TPA: type 1 glutamine amidotransferase domain-containing protein [Kofleriaceae bacterium]|nr:type 1 glutamine amidotransferase domain-containing protein [Kofleriaceae bacterium]
MTNTDRTVRTNRILIATTSHDKKGATTGEPTGAYLSEVSHPYRVFADAGFEIEVASVRGGKVPLDGVDRADETNAALLDDSRAMAKLEASIPSADVDPARYDAIFFAGGHGTMWDLPTDPGFARATAAIYEAGGVVSAVCHGPAALVDVTLSNGAYLVAGKTVSVFTNAEERAVKLETVVPFLLEDRFTERGARVDAAPLWAAKVSVDERLVTGQNPASAAGVAQAVVGLLRSDRGW